MLQFRRETLSQMLIAATIFGAFAIGGAVAILSSAHRERIFRYLLLMLSLSSLIYIFATCFDVILLTTLKNDQLKQQPAQLQQLLPLTHVVTYSVMLGTLVLVSAIAGFGFVFSRRLGWGLLLASIVTVLAFAGLCWHLNQVLHR
ncbi:MAG: hypothetical protein QM703_04950 [Gemmatales bacterium]